MIRRNIPNAITCGNLLCGCLAIVQAFEGHLVWAAYLVGLAAVLDFFDGFAARMLKVSSPIGKDLDSLADMVTFGVVPGVVMYRVFKLHPCFTDNDLLRQLPYPPEPLNDWLHCGLPAWLPFISFMIPVFSAIRLARFNNDTRQTTSFIGVPTPANAIFFCSFPLIIDWAAGQLDKQNTRLDFIANPYFLTGVIIVMSFLMVAELPLFALKFKSFSWADNKIRYLFLALALALIVTLGFIGIPLTIILYIVLSAITNMAAKKQAG